MPSETLDVLHNIAKLFVHTMEHVMEKWSLDKVQTDMCVCVCVCVYIYIYIYKLTI